MKRKIINIVELVLHFITLVVLFTMKCESSKPTGEYYNGLPIVSAAETYWFDEIVAVPTYFILLILLWGTSIVMCAISGFSKKETVDGKMHSALPIINFVVTFWCMLSLPVPNRFLFVAFLMFIIIILGFVKRSSLITGNEKVHLEDTPSQNITNTATSNADELKKYKELLDNGVINQQEFDEKKKQLLRL